MKTEHRAQRPVIAGFYPDPSVCRAGDTYWLACSSFEYAPGVPLFRSTDLLTWEQAGNALTRPTQLDVSGTFSSGGIYAPTLRFHDGEFWLITTNVSDGQGQLLTRATDPAGEWSDPVRLPDVPGIDPELAWDDDGTCYLTLSEGPAGIVQYVLDPATGTLLSERRQLWSGTGGMYPEGPHLYHVEDHWYLMIAEGGTERGHAVTIARGPSPSGPFEPCPHNPILTARGTDQAVQNTGHADLVQRPDGSWAMLYHGVRARGFSPQWHVLGRETFASEIAWVDGWPRLTTPIEPAAGASVTVDELSTLTLPASWVSPSRFPGDVMRRVGGRWQLEGPGFAGRRQQHLTARVTTVIDVRDGVGGLSIRLSPRHRLDIEADAEQVRAVAHSGGLTVPLGSHPVADPGHIRLELRAAEPGVAAGPDEIIAELVTDSGPVELGRLDGRHLSTEVAGGYTGRVIGVWADRGRIGILAFTYTGTDGP
ncbi:family 43 glycosylhydrolase [Actinoplanes sp. CA-054009]